MAGLAKMPTIGRLGGTASDPAKAFPTPPAISHAPARPPSDFHKPAVFPRGPRALGLGRQRQHTGGPGEPPPGFVTATTSAVEWILYWASWKYFNVKGDVRAGPFVGDLIHFEFQVGEGGDPTQARELGGSVSDFLYHLGTGDVIVRLDTFYFHITASATQQAKDMQRRLQAFSSTAIVRTIYDTQLLGDPSGEQAVRALADVLAGREIISPTRSGLAYEIRNEVTGHLR